LPRPATALRWREMDSNFRFRDVRALPTARFSRCRLIQW
jgi:hypothetical protein